MNKVLFTLASLSLLTTSVCAEIDVMENTQRPAPALSQVRSSYQEETSQPEAKKEESWGKWVCNKAYDAGKYVYDTAKDIAPRHVAGYAATAYGTPYLAPVVQAAGEAADWGTSAAVTGLTGCYPLGWVAGKAAKTATLSAGYSVAPSVAYGVGYYAPEIAQGVYNVGEAVVNGVAGMYGK